MYCTSIQTHKFASALCTSIQSIYTSSLICKCTLKKAYKWAWIQVKLQVLKNARPHCKSIEVSMYTSTITSSQECKSTLQKYRSGHVYKYNYKFISIQEHIAQSYKCTSIQVHKYTSAQVSNSVKFVQLPILLSESTLHGQTKSSRRHWPLPGEKLVD